jgi:hypothetical protein
VVESELMAPDSSTAKEGSAFGRMFNVLPAPGEVFQEIKERPVNHANWAVPAVLWMIIGSVLVWYMFSVESFQHELKKQQEKAIQQQVEKGKLKQDQADQILANMPPWLMTLVKVIAIITTTVYAFGIPFFWGFVVWLLCVKVYDVEIEYMKAVEAVGLASIIYVLAAVIGGLLSLMTGKMTFVSPAYFLPEMDMTNRNHMILAALNPFYIWYAAVLAVSISVLANVPVRRTLPWCLGIWVALRALALSNHYTMNFVL